MRTKADLRPAGCSRATLAVLLAMTFFGGGCEVDSFVDPSVLGRWERTPVVLPILDQLDVIDEPKSTVAGMSGVQPSDLIPVVHEYVIGPGDLVIVSVFELIAPNTEWAQARRVDALGMIRLPVLGPLKIEGLSPSQLEEKIVQILDQRGVLKQATVSVTIQESRQNTFSVIGEPRLSGTAIGTYAIPKSDFRLLDAMAMARGATGGIKKLYVIRQVPVAETGVEVIQTPGTATEQPPASPKDPAALIEQLLKSPPDQQEKPQPKPEPSPGKSALDQSLEGPSQPPTQWVNVDGKWVRIEKSPAVSQGQEELIVTQRIIEVPYDKLLEGDMRYNIVVREGDVIRVPPPVIGNVYIGGAISRPGTYSLPGDKDLTLKQLVFAAGNVSPLAIPERVDLIRRVGDDQEAIVRLNLRAIFNGEQPDFYLKPNDTVNVGTSFAATPLAIVRNGLRMTYGFGFLFDRNFGFDVFGPTTR